MVAHISLLTTATLQAAEVEQSWRYRVRRGLLVASRIELRLDYSGSTILVTIAAILRSATNATNHKFGKRHENTGSMQHACSLQLLRISIPNED